MQIKVNYIKNTFSTLKGIRQGDPKKNMHFMLLKGIVCITK